MRFAGLARHGAVPIANTIWLFREQLVRAGAFERLFARVDAMLAEKELVKDGGVPEDWTPALAYSNRAKLASRGRDDPKSSRELSRGWGIAHDRTLAHSGKRLPVAERFVGG